MHRELQRTKPYKHIKPNINSFRNNKTNQYGNYIQYTFTLNDFVLKAPLYAEIKKKLYYYVKQKYSSNVIDKLFDEEMIKCVLQGLMMLDNDGNYVAQKVL